MRLSCNALIEKPFFVIQGTTTKRQKKGLKKDATLIVAPSYCASSSPPIHSIKAVAKIYVASFWASIRNSKRLSFKQYPFRLKIPVCWLSRCKAAIQIITMPFEFRLIS
jgi:hypothetical protein